MYLAIAGQYLKTHLAAMHVCLQAIEEGGRTIAASPLLHDLLRVLVDVRMESDILHTACMVSLRLTEHQPGVWKQQAPSPKVENCSNNVCRAKAAL